MEVNSANDAAVRNKPELREFTITSLGAASAGSTVSVKLAVQAFETSFSPSKSVLIATVPSSPTTLVTRMDSMSDKSQLTVEFAQLSTAQMNGSPVISYSLEIREGTSGDFVVYSGANDIATMLTRHTLKSPWISQGRTYSFRFRAKNAYGWSGYSDVAYITVAGPPDKPSKLIVSSSSTSSIVIALPSALGNGGSPITSVEVVYADGLTSTTYTSFAG